MKDKGWGYTASTGMTYNLYNFLIGIQYHLLSSREAKFSKLVDFITYQNQLKQITESYELFTGSQQIQFLVGYQIQF
jgi:hypothetical protein